MAITTEQLEAMLAAATPGPWAMGPDEEGEPAQCITADGFDIATAWGGYNRADADTRLIAAAPEVTAELIAARRKLEAAHGLVETVEAYKSALKSEMVIPADRGGQWGPKGSAIAKTLERKGEMFAALAAWEAAR